MLKYNILHKDITDDLELVKYDSFSTEVHYDESYNTMFVTYSYSDAKQVKKNDVLKITAPYHYYNDIAYEDDVYTDIFYTKVIGANDANNTFTIIAPRYKNIPLTSVTEVDVDGTLCWEFSFEPTHFFSNDEDISVYITCNGVEMELTDCEYVDYQTLRWVVDDQIDGFDKVSSIVFPSNSQLMTLSPSYYRMNNDDIIDVSLYESIEGYTTLSDYTFANNYDIDSLPDHIAITNSEDVVEYYDKQTPEMGVVPNRTVGFINQLIVSRDQIVYLDETQYIEIPSQDRPKLELASYKLMVNVPLQLKTDVRLEHEGNVKEYFVDYETNSAINDVVEMEKHQYIPTVVGSDYILRDIEKINFNLHFREHSGDNWTVEDSDKWNFNSLLHLTSYNNESNQSDLLSCLGFDNKDVKYQKNRLKKSFLRLSFYDSMNQGNQNLMGYSTIYLDSGMLYSKYMSCYTINAYQTEDSSETLEGARVDREVIPGILHGTFGVDVSSDETIENYRLSSQISVMDRFTSNRTSEGFYLYLWADNDSGIIPSNLYMKAEFNHAGYGRVIPMMAPFWDPLKDNRNGFKTNSEISSDWDNGGYGVKQYLRYSYVHWKYMYSKDRKQHIYYLDPEYYGGLEDNILNINLYEARITF